MHVLLPTGATRSWRTPFLLSLVIHALLAGSVWWLGEQQRSALPAWEKSIDNRLPDAEREFEVALIDVDMPMPSPRRLAAPAPEWPAIEVPTPQPPVVEPPRVTPAAPASPQGTAPPVPDASRAGTGPTGSGAGQATTAFFQVPAQGRSVVYVIDRSASMGPSGRLAMARRELAASLAKLPATARFQVVAYNRIVESLRGELLPATEENKQAALRFVDGLAAEGSTDHGPAMRAALRFGADVVFFLTDADDLRPDTVRALTGLNHGRSAIHTIELTTINRDRHDMPLHVLARENGGKYRAVGVE